MVKKCRHPNYLRLSKDSADHDGPENRPANKFGKKGRPRVDENIAALIIKMRKETNWGYTKIVAPLRNLGHKLSRQTVKNVLKEAGLGSEPVDHPDTWSDFLNCPPVRDEAEPEVIDLATRKIECFEELGGHMHLISRNRSDVVANWTDHEIAIRWLRVFQVEGSRNIPAELTQSDVQMLVNQPERLAVIRERLSDISWFMRAVPKQLT